MNNKKVSAITNIQFTKNFKISVIYLLIYSVALTVVISLLVITDTVFDIFLQVDTFVIATKVFLLILGAVTFYSSFKDYIAQGTTRREFVIGSLTAIALLCMFFTIILTAVYLVVQNLKNVTVFLDDTVILLGTSLLIFYTYYIIGWFMGMAVLKYRIIGRLISLVFSAIAIGVIEVTTSIGFSHLANGIHIISPTSIPLVYNLLSTVIIAFLMTFYVYSKARKIYIGSK